MTNKLNSLIEKVLGDKVIDMAFINKETSIIVSNENYHNVCQILHSNEEFSFEQLSDLCGVDYLDYPDKKLLEKYGRFAVVLHLISYKHKRRIRVKTFLDDKMPLIKTVTDIWSGANWFEREAFDLFGILFEGHEDLRRILTDYGFIGHPFRKDFPMVGEVEVRYDPEQKRVIYQAVSIDERVLVPKVYRS